MGVVAFESFYHNHSWLFIKTMLTLKSLESPLDIKRVSPKAFNQWHRQEPLHLIHDELNFPSKDLHRAHPLEKYISKI